MDDIVTRLQNEADYWCFDTPVRIFIEAADEIKRLREQVRQLEAERDQWQRQAFNRG